MPSWFHFDPAVASAIGTLLIGLTGAFGVVVGVAKWPVIWAFVSDRVTFAARYDELEKLVQALQVSVTAHAKTVKTQAETILRLERDVADLTEVKHKFTALVSWMRDTMRYMALLEKLVDPGKMRGRRRPPIPPILTEHFESPEDLDGEP